MKFLIKQKKLQSYTKKKNIIKYFCHKLQTQDN